MKYLFVFLLIPVTCFSMPIPKSGKWLAVITHYENGVKIDQMKAITALENSLPKELKNESMDKLKASGITKNGTQVCFDENSFAKQIRSQDYKCNSMVIEDTPTIYKSIITCENGIKHVSFKLEDNKTLVGTVKVLDSKGIEIKKASFHSTFISLNCESLKPI